MSLARGMLAVSLVMLGASAIAIGLGNFIIGPEATAGLFTKTLDLAGVGAGPVQGLSSADADSEMRFYAVFWIAYGVAAIHTARRKEDSFSWVVALAALFFLGGVGRLLSLMLVGPPHTLFLILMWIELLLPMVLIALAYLSRRT